MTLADAPATQFNDTVDLPWSADLTILPPVMCDPKIQVSHNLLNRLQFFTYMKAILKDKWRLKNKPSSAHNRVASSLADRIRSARRKAAISQSEMARRIGVSASAVAQWEHPAGTQPSLQSLIRVLEITGVSIDWLVVGKGSRVGNPEWEGGETPAVSLDCFAHCIQEEDLLKLFREIPTKCRSLLLDLAKELSLPRTPERR